MNAILEGDIASEFLHEDDVICDPSSIDSSDSEHEEYEESIFRFDHVSLEQARKQASLDDDDWSDVEDAQPESSAAKRT